MTDPFDDSEEMICSTIAEKLTQPTSISEDIHELLTQTSNYAYYMKEIMTTLGEHIKHDLTQKSLYNKRYHDNHKSEDNKERIKKHHKGIYTSIILESYDSPASKAKSFNKS